MRRGAKLREAAEQNNVGYSTLWGRLYGVTTPNKQELRYRRLSPNEESLLASWARNKEASIRPPTKVQLTRIA